MSEAPKRRGRPVGSKDSAPRVEEVRKVRQLRATDEEWIAILFAARKIKSGVVPVYPPEDLIV